jgi:hypothetical protein
MMLRLGKAAAGVEAGALIQLRLDPALRVQVSVSFSRQREKKQHYDRVSVSFSRQREKKQHYDRGPFLLPLVGEG